ncbi:MAG: BrnT family toxin [Candidatus Hydrogenedentes bacterium]|nr:BrnT family toxin [Candidatus Hydrogenedentota bacterium]
MRIVWHEEKRRQNLIKHKLDFRDAAAVFDGPTFTIEDDRLNYYEQRWITSGLLNGQVVLIVHTETGNTVRIISMRKATQYEQILFFTRL